MVPQCQLTHIWPSNVILSTHEGRPGCSASGKGGQDGSACPRLLPNWEPGPAAQRRAVTWASASPTVPSSALFLLTFSKMFLKIY